MVPFAARHPAVSVTVYYNGTVVLVGKLAGLVYPAFLSPSAGGATSFARPAPFFIFGWGRTNRARSIASQLEAWRGDRELSEQDREAILAVTTGRTTEDQEDQEGEAVYQIGFYWDGSIIVRNGQDHEYRPPAPLRDLLHDWCAEHCKARNFGFPA